jgi:hypothetical protein
VADGTVPCAVVVDARAGVGDTGTCEPDVLAGTLDAVAVTEAAGDWTTGAIAKASLPASVCM